MKGTNRLLDDYILSEAGREIEIMEKGKPISMTTAKTIIRVVNTAAMKGNQAAAKQMISLIKEAETQREKRLFEEAKAAFEYKAKTTQFIKYHVKHGIPFDMPIPHPDHVHIDDETLEVTLTGPAHKEGLKATKVCLNIIASMEVEAMLHGCAQTWVEKALAYEDTNELRRCKHEDKALKKGKVLICEKSKCFISKFQTDDDNITMKFYRMFREQSPVDDPLWKFYGPALIRNWIDFYFYYGLNPRIVEAQAVDGYSPEHMQQTDYPTSIIRLENNNHNNPFRSYMREKLSELMGDAWLDRLKQTHHTQRDIEHDKMRFQYHTGIFNPDNYVLHEGEEELFRDEGFLKEYMAWS